MTTNPLKHVLPSIVLVALATAAPSQAAFRVLRASAPGALASTAPVATVATSPFDDAAARFGDGESYFYAVVDEAGLSLPIAVQRNSAAGCLRLSFDDRDLASAAVSATATTVSVAPSSIRADGLQAAVATIVPRDASGMPLGRGLALSIDAAILWPGRLAGPIEDLIDGSYRALIVSVVPGASRLDVTVEGISLAATPELTFVALDPSGSLRDLAILQLSDLTAHQSRFAALTAAAGAGTDQAAILQRSLAEASGALGSLANGELSRDDNVVKSDIDQVLRSLASLLDAPGILDPADVRDLMNDLLDVARLVALHHLQLAEDGCGVCSNGSPSKVCEAAEALETADAARTVVEPDWTGIVDAYARSVARSVQARRGC